MHFLIRSEVKITRRILLQTEVLIMHRHSMQSNCEKLSLISESDAEKDARCRGDRYIKNIPSIGAHGWPLGCGLAPHFFPTMNS
jgi:hypothetical protein